MSIWYEDGIRFCCRGCGGCCIDRGDYAYVFLNVGEEKSLARALNLDVDEFVGKYTTEVDGYIALVNRGKACVFLDGEKGCSVYSARPLQCRTWPFWPECLEKRVWRAEVAPHCPGIGRGRKYSPGDIDRIAFRSREAEPLFTEEGGEGDCFPDES
ncbi:MAG: YkgJ family cysteine cluster protein [Planctomycetota bacterium]